MKKGNILLAIVICIFVSGFQLISILSKKNITDDEGITYIAATGNQINYENARPKEKWVEVKDWEKMWNQSEFFCFSRIAKGLAQYDIHPPLYFWFLHLWIFLFGVGLITGPLLNILFFLFIFIFMFKIGMKVFHSYILSLGGAFVLGVSPSVMEYMQESRQYALLALMTLIFLSIILSLISNPKKNHFLIYVGLILTATAGMLTHYYFSLLIAGASLVIIYDSFQTGKWKRFIQYIGSLVSAAVLFIILHPYFYLSFQRQQQQARTFATADLTSRIRWTLKTFNSFYFQDLVSKPGFLITLAAFLFLIGLFVFNPKKRRKIIDNISYNQRIILFLFMFLVLFVTGLYLSFISPQHAMSPKYLSMLHIFIVLTTFIIISQFRIKVRNILVFSLCFWQLFMGIWFFQKNYRKSAEAYHMGLSSLKNAKKLLIDSDERSILPAIIWHLQDTVKVYAGVQDSLLNDISWLPMIDSNSIYICDLRFDNTPDKRDNIIELISNQGSTVSNPEILGFNNFSQVYKIK